MRLQSASRLAVATFIAGGLALAQPVSVQAQTVDPRTAEFTPSPDHDRAAADGTPIVTGYELGFYMAGASQPYQVHALGKPAPEVDGYIRVGFSSLSSMPVPGTIYEARVAAVGPGGSAQSAASNTFLFSTPCSFSVGPLTASAGAAGGAGSVSVTTAAGCTWSASSVTSWLTIANGATGSGSGPVTYSVAANTSTLPRSATLTVAGQSVTITQAANTCAYALSPGAQVTPVGGGTLQVDVAVGTGCGWTATSNATWLTVLSGGSGTGNGTVTLTAAQNSTSVPRTATVSAGGQSVSVTQQGSGLVTDPRVLEFTPSSNHSSTTSDGSPVVSRYDLGFYLAGATQAFEVAQLGKPAPDPDGTIRINLSSLPSMPSSGLVYESRVTAVGPGGSATSAVSNAFTFSAPPCSYTVVPLTASTSASAGTGSVTVTTTAGCTWTAASNATWLTIAGGASGSGAGTATYSVASNAGPARSGTLTVAGQTITISQASGCSYGLTPLTQAVAVGGGTATVTVAAGSGCTWTASSNSAWLTVGSGSSGSGLGEVGLVAAANTTSAARSAIVTAGGQSVTVTQAAPAACTFSASPATQSYGQAGGSGSVTVTTTAGCTWTAASNAAWLTIAGGASGSGAGTATYGVASNAGPARSGTLTVAGQTITISQASACSYDLTPLTQAVAIGGGTATVTVAAGSGCTWMASSNSAWLTVSSGGSGTGAGAVNLLAAANPLTSSRTATVTVAGQSVAVTQGAAGAECSYSLSPMNQSSPAGGGAGSVTVGATSGCSWVATSGAAWLRVTGGGSGSGPGTVTFATDPNLTTSVRTATISAGGQSALVTQSAAACTFSVLPTSVSVGASATTGSVTITAMNGCSWTASSPAAWVTLTGGTSGSGNGTVGYSIQANALSGQRTTTLTIAGLAVPVVQAGTPCTYTVAPTTVSIAATGGTASGTVTAGSECAWTTNSAVSWLTVSAASTGSGAFAITATPNTGAATRTGTVTVAGQVVTVSQGAPSTACPVVVNPIALTVDGTTNTATIGVQANATCDWTATSSASWLAISSGATGTGIGSVTIKPRRNRLATRTATVTINGQTVTVTQVTGNLPRPPKGVRIEADR